MSLIDEYNIPKNLAMSVGYVENLHISNKEYYDIATWDPREVRELIDRWDLYYNTNIRYEYVKRRGWELFHALREIIQNALDEQEYVHGYSSTFKISMGISNAGFYIRDYGRGVNLESFVLGGTNKECWMRGYFGEGLKVAAAWFISNGYIMYVFTSDAVYKTAMFGDTVYIIIGKPKYPNAYKPGTEILIYCSNPSKLKDMVDKITFQDYVKKYNPKIISKVKIRTTSCNHERTAYILDVRPVPNMLWVGDIYVNSIKEITNAKSVYSYNLWYVPLEPNRVMVSSILKLYLIVSTVWKSVSEDAYYDLLSKILVESGKNIITLKYDRIFEFDAFSDTLSYRSDYYVIKDKITNALCKYLKCSKDKICILPIKGYRKEDIEWYRYMLGNDVIILCIPSKYENIFSNIDTVDEKLIDVSNERLNSASKTSIGYEYLKYCENIVFTEALYIFNTICKLQGIDVPRVYISKSIHDAAGLNTKNTIYISYSSTIEGICRSSRYRSFLIKTMFEEYSHYIGSKLFGDAPDVSAELEKAMDTCASEMYNVFYHYSNRIESIRSGFLITTLGNANKIFSNNVPSLDVIIDRFCDKCKQFISTTFSNISKFILKYIEDAKIEDIKKMFRKISSYILFRDMRERKHNICNTLIYIIDIPICYSKGKLGYSVNIICRYDVSEIYDLISEKVQDNILFKCDNIIKSICSTGKLNFNDYNVHIIIVGYRDVVNCRINPAYIIAYYMGKYCKIKFS